ncbi:hypothetical protein [Coxiella-like endosymbiont]|uniref:hypothetical protein n=1 Tax=Coxiella-like endosymbiont TaxID=1592897 RepID=UPI00272A2256|nr:hypothetical protein [Coxiella-like endosymbiont]
MVRRSDEKLEMTKSSGNVFADINLHDTENYSAKAELARHINHIILKTKKNRLLWRAALLVSFHLTKNLNKKI